MFEKDSFNSENVRSSSQEEINVSHGELEQPGDILRFWRAIEFFSPQNIPAPDPQNDDEPVFEIKFSLDQELPSLPWEALHPLGERSLIKDKVWKHVVYCAVYPYTLIKDTVQTKFGQDTETFDERIDGDNCVFAFTLSHQGRPLFNSFVLSANAWALSQILNHDVKSSTWLEGFEKCSDQIVLDFETYCQIDEDDYTGRTLHNGGYYVGKPLSGVELQEEIGRVLQVLKLDLGSVMTVRVKSTRVYDAYEYETDDQDFLNSFFIQDLKKISEEADKRILGSALNDFLSSEASVLSLPKIDVRKDLPHVFNTLAPSLFPQGRWPSAGHHPLVLSQQFAINAIFKNLNSERGGVFAVNGPPGTGKTTLLRDLIAGVVVERAKCLLQYEEHSTLFSDEKINWKSGNYKRVLSVWPKEFEKFSIVVASNNNGAVENITLEIPGKKAVDQSWLKEIDYFQEFSTNLIRAPAWALIAARLGNQNNRRSFVQDFWYGEKFTKGDSESLSFWALLKAAETTSHESIWEAALKAFKKALSEEEKIREERTQWYLLIETVEMLTQKKKVMLIEQEELSKKVELLQKALSEMESLCLKAQLAFEESKNKRLGHRQFRPTLTDIIFSLGKAYKIWSQEDRGFAEGMNITRNSFDVLKKQRDSILEEYTQYQKKLNQLSDEVNRINQELMQKIGETHKLKENHPTIPCIDDWLENDAAKEKSSPWTDEAWDHARASLFIAALNLHKAFILANATVFRQNMQAMIDILEGSVPSDAPIEGIKAAWATLFFVIPVVSTTFASFDRLFKHLGKEDIGWLLIDEAGQATPQSAVGGIWRSKKVVVVGDPLQLEPVVTLPLTAQQSLRQHFKIGERWIPTWTSVQMLADSVTSVGTLLPYNDASLWVGSPLRVHRRCDEPMFTISNQIAYDGLMVFGTSTRQFIDLPASCWIDVPSCDAEGHFIPGEAKALEILLDSLIYGGCPPQNIFLISPFRQVVTKLYRLQKSDEMYENIKIGTIHTTQGKESEVVILVLGGDPQRAGAKKWASKKPNLLNVAVSRAKRRLYVIGDRNRWKDFNYFNVLANSLERDK